MKARNASREERIDFVIAGTQKGGTTALDVYLRRHPQVEMAKIKEPHFFDTEENFSAPPTYDDYHSLFNFGSDALVRGEATPIYMYWYDAPRRLWEYNPSLKVILLLRNPIERAYSHWNMERARNFESIEFEEALLTEQIRCREALPLQHRRFSYTDRGFYSDQLRRIWHYFPRDQTLVLKSEVFGAEPAGALEAICSFLDIPPMPVIETPRVHRGNYLDEMPDDCRTFLAALYKEEINELQRLLGWDCSDWLSGTPALNER